MTLEKIMIWLSLIKGLTPRRAAALLEAFNDIRDIWTAPPEDFRDVPYMTDYLIKAIINSRNENIIDKYIKKLHKLNISFVTLKDSLYPTRLKTIHDPPLVLYYLGEIPDNGLRTVGIVGSRRCSDYGHIVSEKISRELARRGIVIVSGMAKGVDSSAHKGAVKAGGKTIAVLGCGVDICYPAENRTLRDQIIKNGCVLSEYPPGTKPLQTNFPERNRIISGLSEAVVVAEAAFRSGTLITADMALEQGRELMAVPGNITSALSAGTNNLIKQGAVLVSDYTDVLHAISIDDDIKPVKDKKNKPLQVVLAKDEKLVYDCINFEPEFIQTIAAKASLPVTAAASVCTMLEINGLVAKLPGQRYIRI